MVALLLPVGPAHVRTAANIVGEGFTVTPADLAFILKQIKIAEAHSAVLAAQGPGDSTDPMRCQSMIGTGPNQIESPLLSFGLRTVDGTCNNLQPGQETYGAADQTFPRLTTPMFKPPRTSPPTSGRPARTHVVRADDRLGDRLRAAHRQQPDRRPDLREPRRGRPLRASPCARRATTGVVPCTTEPTTPGGTDGLPAGCVPAHTTLDIPNVTTDVGLSPPFNSLFTIFGQFFDHGLDKITNGGNGTVFVPLKADDPLVAGPGRHPRQRRRGAARASGSWCSTRGTIVTGPDGFRERHRTPTPRSSTRARPTPRTPRTRSSCASTSTTRAGQPVTTGKFLSSPDGGLATWAMVKDQARDLLGLELVDTDVNNIPMIEADPYGNFIPGPHTACRST